MKKLIKAVLLGLLFFAVGELLIRVDQKTHFFKPPLVKNETKPSRLIDNLKAGTFQPRDDEFRIMLLGDSALYGLGMPANEAFSAKLTEALDEKQPNNLIVRILDLTKPGNNTFANIQSAETYLDDFKPNLILWAYNLNDNYGRMSTEAKPGPEKNTKSEKKRNKLETVRNIRRMISNSELALFVIQKLNMQLKLKGVVVQGSEFHHLLKKSHTDDYKGWTKSQKLIAKFHNRLKAQDTDVLVLMVPELNMMRRRDLFEAAEGSAAAYFHQLGVPTLNLADAVQNPDKNYAISPYDGHPNAEAHAILADWVAERLVGSEWLSTGSEDHNQERLNQIEAEEEEDRR